MEKRDDIEGSVGLQSNLIRDFSRGSEKQNRAKSFLNFFHLLQGQ
jgi:hypothetical protein